MKTATTTSIKGLPTSKDKATGKNVQQEFTINVYEPTGEEWVAHFTRGLDRMAEELNGHKIANNLASRLKAASALANGISEIEKPSDKSVAAAKALYARVVAGDVFDLREFVPQDGRADKDTRTAIENFAAVLGALNKWDSLPVEKRAAFLAMLASAKVDMGDTKTDTAQADVIAAFNTGAKPTATVDIDALLA